MHISYLSIASIPPLLVAAISIYVGYHYLKIYLATQNTKHHLFFAISALLLAAYASQSAGLYNAASIYQGVLWQRAELATFFVFGIFLMWFIYDYTGCLSKRMTVLCTIYQTFAALIQFIDRSPRTWIMDTRSIKSIDLLNIKITYFEATSGWLTNLTTLLAMLVALFIFSGVIRFYQMGEKKKFTPIFISSVLLFLGSMNDTAVVLGFYKFFYLLEYACLGIILVISDSLSTGFIQSLAMKDELEIKNQELTRIKDHLEKIVIERTNHIAEQKQYYETLVESAPIAIVTLDLQHHILSLNPAFEKMFGYSRDEVVGKNIDELITTDLTRPQANSISARVIKGECIHVVAKRKRKDNTVLDVDIQGVPVILEGTIVGILGIYNDITEIKQVESKLQYLSTHDPLTDLPNRILFFDRLSHALTLSRRSNHNLAILFLDLDGFKEINDTHGHHVGDLLLQIIATRIKQVFSRESDTIARFGGDEFVIMLENPGGFNTIHELGRMALDAIAMPIKIDHLELQVYASIGISIFPDDGETVDVLIEKADKAMYHAKKVTPKTKIINYAQISKNKHQNNSPHGHHSV